MHSILNVEEEIGYTRCGIMVYSQGPVYKQDIITIVWRGCLYNKDSEKSDPEYVIHMYLKWGMFETLRRLNGDYTFCLLDPKIHENESLFFIARDAAGVIPLFTYKNQKEIHITSHENRFTEEVRPACFSTYALSHMVHSEWQLKQGNTPYYLDPIPIPYIIPREDLIQNMEIMFLKSIDQRFLHVFPPQDFTTLTNKQIVMILEEGTHPLFSTCFERIKRLFSRICGASGETNTTDCKGLPEHSEKNGWENHTPAIVSMEHILDGLDKHCFVFSVENKVYTSLQNHSKVFYPCLDLFYLQYIHYYDLTHIQERSTT